MAVPTSPTSSKANTAVRQPGNRPSKTGVFDQNKTPKIMVAMKTIVLATAIPNTAAAHFWRNIIAALLSMGLLVSWSDEYERRFNLAGAEQVLRITVREADLHRNRPACRCR